MDKREMKRWEKSQVVVKYYENRGYKLYADWPDDVFFFDADGEMLHLVVNDAYSKIMAEADASLLANNL